MSEPTKGQKIQDVTRSKQIPDLIWEASHDERTFWGLTRLLSVVFVLIGATVFGVIILVRYLPPPISVLVKDSGAIQFTTNNTPQTSIFLLSANGGDDSPWVDSGIEIRNGETVTIKASGKVCVGYHRMMQTLDKHDLPPLPWTGPEGLDYGAAYPPHSLRPEERLRSDFKLAKNDMPGRIIGVISSTKPSSKPGESASEDGLGKPISIGPKKTFTAKTTGNLWLAINEIWLAPDLVAAYKPNTEKEFKQKILDKKYWNAFYDDNAGSFLVTVQTSK